MWLLILVLPIFLKIYSSHILNSNGSITTQDTTRPYSGRMALAKRVHFSHDDCTDEQLRVINNVLDRYVVPMSLRAAEAANTDPNNPEANYYDLKFLEYFATIDRQTRIEVFKRFAMIRWEARHEWGRILIFCNDELWRDDPEVEAQPCQNHPGQEHRRTFATSDIVLNFIVLVFSALSVKHGDDLGYHDSNTILVRPLLGSSSARP